jgi:hypothetical protein
MYETDKASIPNSMDKKLGEYDISESIGGEIGYTVDKKDAKEITLCITSFSCKPQVRMKNEEEY